MGFDAVPEPLKKSSSVLRDPLTGVRIISGPNTNVYREEWRRGANHGGVCICKRCTCDKQKAIRCPCRCHEQVKYVSRRRLAAILQRCNGEMVLACARSGEEAAERLLEHQKGTGVSLGAPSQPPWELQARPAEWFGTPGALRVYFAL